MARLQHLTFSALGGFWLLVFVLPYAVMQIGLVAFLRAVWKASPQALTLPRW